MRFPDSVLTLTCSQFSRLPDKFTGSDIQQVLTHAESTSSVGVLDDPIRTQDVHVSTTFPCYASQEISTGRLVLVCRIKFGSPGDINEATLASPP